jgi:putative transposase
VETADSARSIVSSFKRNDVRIGRELTAKHGKRRREYTRQIFNCVSKSIVVEAKHSRQAIAFEDIRGIRELYRKGNGQVRGFRGG